MGAGKKENGRGEIDMSGEIVDGIVFNSDPDGAITQGLRGLGLVDEEIGVLLNDRMRGPILELWFSRDLMHRAPVAHAAIDQLLKSERSRANTEAKRTHDWTRVDALDQSILELEIERREACIDPEYNDAAVIVSQQMKLAHTLGQQYEFNHFLDQLTSGRYLPHLIPTESSSNQE